MKRLLLFIGLVCFSQAALAQKPAAAKKLSQRLTTQAQFPGGDSAMVEFIHENLRYPQMERDNDIQGKVVVRFMIDKAGNVGDIKLAMKVSPGLDKEALRVTNLMPTWKPAMYHNKPITVYYVLPITFRLEKS